MLHDILARLSAFGCAPLSPGDRFFVGYLAVALVTSRSGRTAIRRRPASRPA
jgi:hypothetical protein